jgi:hypothetical protein
MATTNSMNQMVEDGIVKIVIAPIDSRDVVRFQPLDVRVSVMSQLPLYEEIKLEYFDVEGAVVKIAPNLSQNTNQQIEGLTWYSQQVKVTIYPLKAGQFEIPSILTTIAVENQSKQVIRGKLKTTGQQHFTIAPLDELESVDKFVASPNVKLTAESSTKISTKTVKVGNAVEMTYEISADNLDVMMLPSFNSQPIEGVEIYAQPPKDENVQNRLTKRTTAVRTQTVTYVFNESGEVKLPTQTVLWWNTKTKTLEKLSTKGIGFIVEGSAQPLTARIFENLSNVVVSYWNYLLAMFVLLLFLVRSIARFWPDINEHYKQKRAFRARSLITLIEQQVENNDVSGIVDSIYKIAKVRGLKTGNLVAYMDKAQKKIWLDLMASAYDNHQPKTVSIQEIKTLVHALTPSTPHKFRRSRFVFTWSLNPDKE